MAYYLNLFSPETYAAFTHSNKTIIGFRNRQQGMANRIKAGDVLICYVTRLSRWCGLLEIVDGPFLDDTPIFMVKDDPYIVRFHVGAKVWLPLHETLPIHLDEIWQQLSFTQSCDKKSTIWTGFVRCSLNKFTDKDGKFLASTLLEQSVNPELHPLDEKEQKSLKVHIVNRIDKVVEVSVPDNDDEFLASDKQQQSQDVRESIKMQALLAQIGALMGLRIWLPKADRCRVLKEWKNGTELLLDHLPLNYDEATLSTIEQIDVIWLKGRSIVRAFEVEHTTSIYSGLLRMADLLALQPNMNINLHIVAPDARKGKVFQEIRRPVFSLLDKGPLFESCSYISYSNLKELSKQKHLNRMTDAVVDDYAEKEEL